MTVQEAIDLIKQVPLYRYECDLEKCRQSDLFNALNIAINCMEKQIPKKPTYEGDGYADGHIIYDTWICPCCKKKIRIGV